MTKLDDWYAVCKFRLKKKLERKPVSTRWQVLLLCSVTIIILCLVRTINVWFDLFTTLSQARSHTVTRLLSTKETWNINRTTLKSIFRLIANNTNSQQWWQRTGFYFVTINYDRRNDIRWWSKFSRWLSTFAESESRHATNSDNFNI